MFFSVGSWEDLRGGLLFFSDTRLYWTVVVMGRRGLDDLLRLKETGILKVRQRRMKKNLLDSFGRYVEAQHAFAKTTPRVQLPAITISREAGAGDITIGQLAAKILDDGYSGDPKVPWTECDTLSFGTCRRSMIWMKQGGATYDATSVLTLRIRYTIT
jgi:hypothetical protein